MATRTRKRTAAASGPAPELPDQVKLYPDPHHYIPGVPHDIITVDREKAEELLAYGRHNADGAAAWNGEPFAPAFHLEQQVAVFEDQIGEHTPFADPPTPEPPPTDEADGDQPTGPDDESGPSDSTEA